MTIDDAEIATFVTLTNLGNQARFANWGAIDLNANGTLRPNFAEGPGIGLGPGETTTFRAPEGQSLLEVSGAPQIIVSATHRMTDFRGRVSWVEAPTISSENLLPSGTTAHLQRLRNNSEETTHVALLNLAHESTECAARLSDEVGAQIGGNFVLSLLPLSLTVFQDVPGGLVGGQEIDNVSLTFTCDGDYFPMAITIVERGSRNERLASMEIITSAESLGSKLLRPGEEPPVPPCPDDGECFRMDGDFYRVTGANPTRVINIPVSADRTFSQILLSMSFTHGGWYGPEPSGLHNIAYLNRGGRFAGNTFGFIFARGPNRNLIGNEITVDLPRGQNSKVTQVRAMVPGQRYFLEYLYDGRARIVALTIVDSQGNVIVNLSDIASGPVRTEGGDWTLQFSDQYFSPHVPNLNWIYHSFDLQFIP